MTETTGDAAHRPCPFCAETIPLTAAVCPHCKRDLVVGENLDVKKPIPTPGAID